MKEDSDIAARVEFNLGTNSAPVWFGNVRLEEIDSIPFDHDSAKTPLVNGNHLYNGEFNLGESNRMSFWHTETANAAAVSPSVDMQGRLNLQITDGGSEAGDVKLLQKGIYLMKGHDYGLTFDAASSTARTAAVQLLGKDGSVYAEQAVNLTEVNQEIKVKFTNLAGVTDHEGQLVLALGGSAGTVTLDNFSLIRTSNLVINGSFDNGKTGWSTWSGEGGVSEFTVNDGAADILITAAGSQAWHTQLFQEGIQMEAGKTYELSFKAKSTIPREVIVEYSGTSAASSQAKFDITATWATYSAVFTVADNKPLKLNYLIGKTLGTDGTANSEPHTLSFDDISLKMIDAPVIPVSGKLDNGTFDEGDTGWVKYFDGTGSAAVKNGELAIALTGIGQFNYSAQVAYANLKIVQGKTYKVTFSARSTVDRKIEVVVEKNGGDYTKYTEPEVIKVDLTNSDNNQEYSFTFTMNKPTDAAAHIAFLVGKVAENSAETNNAIAGSTIYLDNVTFEEVTP